MAINRTITDFVTLAIQFGGWMELDRLYLQNRISSMVGAKTIEPVAPDQVSKKPSDLLHELINYAQMTASIKIGSKEQEILSAQLMDFLTPPPSVVNAFFAKHYERSPKEATDYFYQLNKKNLFIKSDRTIDEDSFSVNTIYGKLDFILNKSIHEHMEEQTKNEKEEQNYPKCLLCFENEGYAGRSNYPARSTQRIIRMNLDNESWGFSYSPCELYKEHSFIARQEHKKSRITKKTIQQLFEISQIFPHYFVGIQGESLNSDQRLIAHDHYLTGCHVFPLEKAIIEQHIELVDYPLITIGIVKWPLSVLRLKGPSTGDLIEAITMICEEWHEYQNDERVTSVKEYANISMVLRRKERLFEIDLLFGGNNTTIDNIFESTQLSLFEAMGLVNISSKSAKDIEKIKQFITGKNKHIENIHYNWAIELKKKYAQAQPLIDNFLQEEISSKFVEKLASNDAFLSINGKNKSLKEFILSLNGQLN